MFFSTSTTIFPLSLKGTSGFFPPVFDLKKLRAFTSMSPGEVEVSNASCTTNCLAPLTKVPSEVEVIRWWDEFGCSLCVGCVFLFFVYFVFWRGGGVESQGFVCSKHFQEQKVTIQNSWRWNLHVGCFVSSSWNILGSFDLGSCKISMKPKWMMGMLRWSQTTVFAPDDGEPPKFLWSIGEDGFFSG